MLYTCNRCKKYQTTIKCNYIRHLNRKKLCPKYIQNRIPRDTQTESQMNHSESQMNHSESQMNHSEQKTFHCPHCNKVFSTNSNMNRHIRLYCKEQKKNLHIEKLEKENEKLQAQIMNINTTNSFNTINNNQKIIINAYGKEDLDHILPQIPILIKNFPTTAVTDMICETYYNPKYPENKTVKINSTKEKWAQIYNGTKWDVHKKMDTVMDVLHKSFKLIDKFFEEHNIKQPEYMKNKITWEEIRNMWYDDIYPDQEMKDTAEEILINQNQTSSKFRKFLKYKESKNNYITRKNG